jgi:hypothetical protein
MMEYENFIKFIHNITYTPSTLTNHPLVLRNQQTKNYIATLCIKSPVVATSVLEHSPLKHGHRRCRLRTCFSRLLNQVIMAPASIILGESEGVEGVGSSIGPSPAMVWLYQVLQPVGQVCRVRKENRITHSRIDKQRFDLKCEKTPKTICVTPGEPNDPRSKIFRRRQNWQKLFAKWGN